MNRPMRRLLAVLALVVLAAPVRAEVIETLGPAVVKRVALTFDACEGRGKPAFFDQAILDYLTAEHLPFTVFATGLFARRNRAELAAVAALPQAEVENHSFDHPQHMERLSPDQVRDQVARADQEIEAATGRKPRFFRFPAGNYDAATLAVVEATGHRVVHWRFASGDPARGLTPERLTEWVLLKARPGDVLIFHINGRAPATAPALPVIVSQLRRRGYEFVRLDQVLP